MATSHRLRWVALLAGLATSARGLAISASSPSTVRPVAHCRAAAPRCQDVAVASAEERDVALAFGAALSAAWAGRTDVKLSDYMSSACTVETPVWNCADLAAYRAELAESRKFFSALSTPSLTVLSHTPLGDGRAKLTWQLGVEWPAVWRPRVNILGESLITMSSSNAATPPRVTRVVETWHQAPLAVFAEQVLPKFRDVASLWNSPSAEHVPLPLVGTGDGFELRRVPPMLCLQAEWTEVGQQLLREQAPLPPYYAFTGQVRRTEWYNCVSPGFLERSFCQWPLPGGMTQPGQIRRWFAPLPSRFADADPATLPSFEHAFDDDDDGDGDDARGGDGRRVEGGAQIGSLPAEVVSASVAHVRRPSQLLAVRALKEIPSNDAVLTAALELTAAAEAAGYAVEKREGRPVIMQLSDDVKWGFNDKRELAMSVWLSVPDSLRGEYVGVVLDESAGGGGGAAPRG